MAGLDTFNVAASTAAVTNRFVASTNMSLTPYTIANASPVWAGGCLVTITHTTVAGADTLGTITIVGTDLWGMTQSETLTPVAASTVTSKKVFRTVVSATSVGWVAVSTADTIVIGCAAGSIVAQGGGIVKSLIVNVAAAATVILRDGGGVINTYPVSLAVGTYALDVAWSGWLSIETTSTNDVSVVSTTGVGYNYAMS